MWAFIVLNLHQFTDYKAQVNQNNLNNRKSNNTARSYQAKTNLTQDLEPDIGDKPYVKMRPQCDL